MGRESGYIAAYTGLASGAFGILIPEKETSFEELVEKLDTGRKNGKTSSIVVVAEGDNTGENVFDLKKYVEKHLPDYEARVSVLGHMQRGGSPSCFDRVLASRLGVKAVESMINGENSVMTGLKNNDVMLTPFKKAIKGITKINTELLKVSDIMSI